MDGGSTVKFDINELLNRAGEVTFAKGIALVKSQSVHHLHLEDGDVLATVEGTLSYKVQLTNDSPIECHCTCPAAEYQDVCKHAVAVAMQANITPQEIIDEKAILYRYFVQKTPEELAEIVLDCLRNDDAQWSRWLTRAEVVDEDTVTLSQLKHRVDDALPQIDLWGWGESRGYFHDAEIQFDAIWSALESLQPDEQWSLIQYIIERLNLVLEHIDDSDGARFDLEQAIGRKMPEIFERLDWRPERKAQWMFEHLTLTEYDVFPSIEEDFADIYVNNELFLTRCQEMLDKLSNSDDARWKGERYAAPLVHVARQSGNWQEEVRIKAKLAQRTHDYIALSQLCLHHDEALDAERWLLKARKLATSKYDKEACDRKEVEIREALGEYSGAWMLANRLFEGAPSYKEYLALCQLQSRCNIADPTFLSRVERSLKEGYQPPDGRYIATRSDDLLRFYIEQHRLNEACAWVETRKVSSDALIELANEVISDKPEIALNYYSRVVCATIEQTNNGAYDQALRYLQTLEKRLEPYPSVTRLFYAQVSSIAQTYKRKRNMFALFKKHYAKYL